MIACGYPNSIGAKDFAPHAIALAAGGHAQKGQQATGTRP
jgi:hypothetical protein